MVWVCYSSSLTCTAFVVALLGRLLLCHVSLWWHKTTPGWFYHPKGGDFIPQKQWFYHPKAVVLFFLKVGMEPSRVVLSPIWGWFYARDRNDIYSNLGGRSCAFNTSLHNTDPVYTFFGDYHSRIGHCEELKGKVP